MLLHRLPDTHNNPFINKLRRESLITREGHFISSQCGIIELLVAWCARCKYAHKLNFGWHGPRTHRSNQAPAPPPAAAERRLQPALLFWLGLITNTLNWISVLDAVFLHNVLPETGVSHLWSLKRQTQPVNKSKQIRGHNGYEGRWLFAVFQRHCLQLDKPFSFIFEMRGSSRSRQEPLKLSNCHSWGKTLRRQRFFSWHGTHLKLLRDQGCWRAVFNLLFVNVILMYQINGLHSTASICDTNKTIRT